MVFGIASDDAAIMSVVLEGILYGFSLLMFIGTIWALTRDECRRASSQTTILIAVVLLVLSTAHMVVDIVRTYEGLVKYRDTFPGGPLGFFADISQYTYVTKNAIYTSQTLLGDGVVIYRCYAVWQSVWIIILPSMLWCTVAVTGVASVYSASKVAITSSDIFAKQTGQWVTAFFASTLTTNLVSAGLLAYRIWIIERNIAPIRATNSTMMPLLRVLVDAALLYSATLFTALLCFVNSNNGEYVVVSMIMPIISIAFYMVLIRIAMRQKSMLRRGSTMLRETTNFESQKMGRRARQSRVHMSRNDCVPPSQLGDQKVEWDPLSFPHDEKSDGTIHEA